MKDETKTKKQTKQPKAEKPGNDVLNGIERWVPDGTDKPKQFRHEDANHVWYRNKWEASACVARAGHPESEWVPVLKGDESESEASGQPEA